MGILTYTAGWATIGFGVRIYQLGVMRRNLFESELASSTSKVCVMVNRNELLKPFHSLMRSTEALISRTIYHQEASDESGSLTNYCLSLTTGSRSRWALFGGWSVWISWILFPWSQRPSTSVSTLDRLITDSAYHLPKLMIMIMPVDVFDELKKKQVNY